MLSVRPGVLSGWSPDVQAENYDIYPLVDIGMVRQIRIDARKDLYA